MSSTVPAAILVTRKSIIVARTLIILLIANASARLSLSHPSCVCSEIENIYINVLRYMFAISVLKRNGSERVNGNVPVVSQSRSRFSGRSEVANSVPPSARDVIADTRIARHVRYRFLRARILSPRGGLRSELQEPFVPISALISLARERVSETAVYESETCGIYTWFYIYYGFQFYYVVVKKKTLATRASFLLRFSISPEELNERAQE